MKTISITDPKEMKAVIRQCPYCMVGITDADGHPYVIPMNFAYEKGIISSSTYTPAPTAAN